MSALTDLHRVEANTERNTNGQFKAGNKGGPGNPFAGQVSLLRKAVLECVTTEDLHGIVKGLIQMAKDGHWQAAKLILAYAIGKPGSLPEPDGMVYPMETAYVNPPSANGSSSEPPPSANGVFGAPPSTNAVSAEPAPSANGDFASPAPLANGLFDTSLNRKQPAPSVRQNGSRRANATRQRR